MNTQIYEDATEWLIKHREGDLDSSQKAQFDAWLRESPQHVRAYLEMSAIWEDLPALGADWNPAPEQLVADARSEVNVRPLTGKPSFPGRAAAAPLPLQQESRVEPARMARGRLFGTAAVLLLAIGAVATWLAFDRNTYATQIGEQRSILLADGSTLELNSRSRVRVRYTKQRRDVDLIEGQALFRVAHNTARPFVVHSGRTQVLAIGTQFDVYQKQASTVVTVVDGKVEVLADPALTTSAEGPTGATQLGSGPEKSGGHPGIYLAAGQQLTIRTGGSSHARAHPPGANPQTANIAATTAWTQHNLIFDSTPLTEVAAEFNRYNRRPLVIIAAEIGGMRISGMFSSADPELFLKFLRAQPELNVEETDREIRISKR